MSAKITPEEVQKIAALARLGLTEQEQERAATQISGILDHFSVIQKIDTKDVPTSDDVTGLSNVTRDDEAHAEALCATDAILEAAPELKDKQIKVKAIFD